MSNRIVSKAHVRPENDVILDTRARYTVSWRVLTCQIQTTRGKLFEVPDRNYAYFLKPHSEACFTELKRSRFLTSN